MTVYNQIFNSIADAKAYAYAMADGIIYEESNGGNSGCEPLQLVVLTNWIAILEDYLNENFDEDGQPITDPTSCLTLKQALDLVAKIKALTC